MNLPTISPRELCTLLQSSAPADLIDVRTPVEFRAVHAIGARCLPLDVLDPAAIPADNPIYLICKSGQRAAKAAQKFVAAGLPAPIVVEGGTAAWQAAGLPVEIGKASMSLERQVRIAAGSLALLGTILAAAVSIWFLILPAFIGSGLIFAGLTDWCGMGLLLAKAPWNQTPPVCATPTTLSLNRN